MYFAFNWKQACSFKNSGKQSVKGIDTNFVEKEPDVFNKF
jgi:hypothetical protein